MIETEMDQIVYETDLTVEQYHLIAPYVVRGSKVGRPPKICLRLVLNAIFYLLRTGCQWRLLPKEYPHWSAVRYYYDKWRRDGVLELINRELVARSREAVGRNAEPTLGIIDSQSARTSEVGGVKGIDGYKKIKGRKRFIIVDICGNILAVLVFPANLAEKLGGQELVELGIAAYPSLKKILGDQGYRGAWIDEFEEETGVEIEITERDPDRKGFVVQKKRWIVERTIAWMNRYRRLSKDYEYLAASSEAMIYLASIHMMVRRLASNSALPRPYQNKVPTHAADENEKIAA